MKTRIATVCQAGQFHNSVEENRKHVLRLMDLALRSKPDLICLPEAFTTVSVQGKEAWDLAEPIPGPTTEAFAERAKANECYVICPINTRREGKVWNSAVVIDRSGVIIGIYDKIHPVTTSHDFTVFEHGVMPGKEIPVFDLDFGRVGIQICFDAGFPETWEGLSAKGAKMVVWSSAYNGGFPLQVYAYLHHYYVVSSVRSDRAKIIDPCGRILDETDRLRNVIWRDINLDFVVSHYDFNYSVPDKIMKTYPGRVEIRSHLDDGHFLVESLDDDLTTEKLKNEFGFESTFQYHQRHRDAYNLMNQGKKPIPQKAAHGERPQYAKVE